MEACKNGHALTPDNVKLRKVGARQWKVCRECHRKGKRKTGRSREEWLRGVAKHKQMSFTLYPARPKGESKKLSSKRQRQRIAAIVIEMKNAPCMDCGGRFHFSAMDFDHLPGFTKRDAISQLVSQGRKAVVINEIKKCDLVCANCHRVRTFKRMNGNGG